MDRVLRCCFLPVARRDTRKWRPIVVIIHLWQANLLPIARGQWHRNKVQGCPRLSRQTPIFWYFWKPIPGNTLINSDSFAYSLLIDLFYFWHWARSDRGSFAYSAVNISSELAVELEKCCNAAVLVIWKHLKCGFFLHLRISALEPSDHTAQRCQIALIVKWNGHSDAKCPLINKKIWNYFNGN